MKKILLSIIFAHISTLGFSQQIYMPDDYLENYFETNSGVPFNNDNYVSTTILANFFTIVVNTPNGPTRGVAELTLAMTMSLLRRIPQADSALKKRKWEKQMGNLILDKQIGVIGLGRIGKMVSELFRGIGNPVIAFDIYPDEQWANDKGVKLRSFDEVICESDILTLHIPGNKDNKAIIGDEEIQKMKSGAFIINISRGGVVDEDALYHALITKKLAGAAIDVFSREPYDGPLCDLDNIIMTPHLGSYAKEDKVKMEIDAVNNLMKVLKNKL